MVHKKSNKDKRATRKIRRDYDNYPSAKLVKKQREDNGNSKDS